MFSIYFYYFGAFMMYAFLPYKFIIPIKKIQINKIKDLSTMISPILYCK